MMVLHSRRNSSCYVFLFQILAERERSYLSRFTVLLLTCISPAQLPDTGSTAIYILRIKADLGHKPVDVSFPFPQVLPPLLSVFLSPSLAPRPWLEVLLLDE